MITSKLPNVGTTIFTRMSQLALEENAINLGQGYPEYNPDEKLLKYVYEAMLQGHNQYAYMPGIEELREQIALKIETEYGQKYDPLSEVTVTAGATEALMAAILSSTKAGDEVIVIDPSFDCYRPAIKLSGANCVTVALDFTTDKKYLINWNKVKQAITNKTRLIILNFPHNPTGITLDKNDLDQLEEIVQNNNLYLLSDEVYEHIVFDKQKFLSLSSRPALVKRSFIISSFGKTYHTTGWKIGYCCAPKELTVEFRKLHQFMVFSVNTPMQYGLARFMADGNSYQHLSNFYELKRNLVRETLKDSAFHVLPCKGTFFQLIDYSQLSDKSEEEFSLWLTKEKKVTLIPVSAFYNNPSSKEANKKILRLCFAKNEDTLLKALNLLKSV